MVSTRFGRQTRFPVEVEQGRPYDLHRCMELDLRFVDEKTYLTVDPTYYIEATTEADVEPIMLRSLGRSLVGNITATYNSDLDYWRNKLSKEE